MPLLSEGKINENNRVLICVWKYGISDGQNAGNVAIKTPNRYINLWPADEPSDSVRQFFKTRERSANKKTENEQDVATFICLYSLNVKVIEEKFDKVKGGLAGWVLLNETLLRNNGSTQSCASLALEILKAGGLADLIKNDVRINSSAVTSDEMIQISKEAKQAELSRFTKTQGYKFEGEAQVEQSKQVKTSTYQFLV